MNGRACNDMDVDAKARLSVHFGGDDWWQLGLHQGPPEHMMTLAVIVQSSHHEIARATATMNNRIVAQEYSF